MNEREPVIPIYAQEFLDQWWATEPFGFDHPDTYNGILRLLNEAEARGREGAAEIVARYMEPGWEEKKWEPQVTEAKRLLNRVVYAIRGQSVSVSAEEKK